jgi:prepilin-type N-terminal cleavage/methylation domain-containing protein
MKPLKKVAEAGFTLIEAIITMVVIALAATMIVSFFGANITQTSTPIVMLNTAGNLKQIMDKITAQYRQIPHWHPNTTYAVNAVVLPTTPNANGFQYICTVAGTSGASEPGWPIVSNATVADNTITWRQNGAAPPLTGLQTAIGAEGTEQTNSFGSYSIVRNRFIKFDANNYEQNIDPLYGAAAGDPAYGRFLKVIIGLTANAPNRTAETLTTLFVMR